MSRWTILSFEGVGPVRFGMTREEIRQTLNAEVEEFRKSAESPTLSDLFIHHDAVAFYDIDYRLEAMEFGDTADLTWNGTTLTGRPLKAILENVRGNSNEVEIDFDGVTFHDLGFGVWSPGWLEDDSEMPQAVIAFRRGYYSR